MQNVPDRFIGQVICQIMVTKTNFYLLFKLSEIRLLELVIIHYAKFLLNKARRKAVKNFRDIIS